MDLTFGEFAIGMVLDQNGKKVLDTTIFGISTQSVDFANSFKLRMGPPKYSNSLITFNQSTQRFVIKLLNTS